MALINLVLFLVPFIGAVAVALQSGWTTLVKGVLIIVLTPILISLLLPAERLLARRLSRRALSYAAAAWAFALVACSIAISWEVINSARSGNWRFFLFAWAVCYVPYTYMLQAEMARGRVNTITNVTNNFAVLGYVLFGAIANFTALPAYLAAVAPATLGAVLFASLPARIRDEMAVPKTQPNSG